MTVIGIVTNSELKSCPLCIWRTQKLTIWNKMETLSFRLNKAPGQVNNGSN